MERKYVYEAFDGEIFDTEDECLEHESRVQREDTFTEWYDTNDVSLYVGLGHSYVESNKLIDWLEDNREKVLYLFGVDEYDVERNCGDD